MKKNILLYIFLIFTIFIFSENVMVIFSGNFSDSNNENRFESFYKNIDKDKYSVSYEYIELRSKTYDSNFYDNFYTYLNNKYIFDDFSSFVFFGEEAVDFSLKYLDKQINYNIPFFFYGIDVSYKEFLSKRYTGVFENISFYDTVNFIKHLQPDIKNILVFGNGTEKFNREIKIIKEDILYFREEINFHIYDNINVSDILDILNFFNNKSAVIVVSPFLLDNNTLSDTETTKYIVSKYFNIPVYSLRDSMVGKGIIGGRVISGIQQGEIAVKILNGSDENNYYIYENKYVADYDSVIKYGININNIPKNTEIINEYYISKNFSFAVILIWVFIVGFLITVIFIMCLKTRKMKNLKDEVLYNFEHDVLTGTYNRNYFQKYFDIISRKSTEPFAVFFIDIDNQKIINDIYGYNAGDLIIKEVSKRLTESFEKDDVIARFSGDEFGGIIKNFSGLDGLYKKLDKMVINLNKKFHIENYEINVYSSTGVALFPYDGITLDVLLRNIDIAMHKARTINGNTYRVYNRIMKKENDEILYIKTKLKNAIETGDDLDVFYQPIVDLSDFSISHVEALIRWKDGEKGYISPEKFIQIAEENGLIFPLGEFVLRKVCRDLNYMISKGMYLNVAINLSPQQFYSDKIIDVIRSILINNNVMPQNISFEVTETVAMQNIDFTVEILNEMKKLGHKIYLDDFGTGYSSLNYLAKLPVDSIKIDKSFIDDIEEKESSKVLVKAIISMAHSMNIFTIAEGVENNEQLRFLKEINCNKIQGYIYSKPLPLSQLVEFHNKISKTKFMNEIK